MDVNDEMREEMFTRFESRRRKKPGFLLSITCHLHDSNFALTAERTLSPIREKVDAGYRKKKWGGVGI